MATPADKARAAMQAATKAAENGRMSDALHNLWKARHQADRASGHREELLRQSLALASEIKTPGGD